MTCMTYIGLIISLVEFLRSQTMRCENDTTREMACVQRQDGVDHLFEVPRPPLHRGSVGGRPATKEMRCV